ncbi:MAG: DNA-processing protein DprA [Candidatus Omnitrophica bacterium]|nr:DNA-processing protein DprA [Candidatus Omnitrophota bacterium]
MTNSLDDLILLNSIDTLGFKRLSDLLAAFGSTSRIIDARGEELVSVPGIDEKTASRIKGLDKRDAAGELKFAREHGISIISIFDEAYPKNLKNTYSPPIVLYIKGRIVAEDEDAIAVVGTRMPSQYGRSFCEHISAELASRGITVVSGMARGIDTVAHKGAMKKGRTIAVLGSGLERIYPPENKRLFEEICDRGCAISEFRLKTPPYRFNFPRRNRIIAGLALGVLVVEASEKSGSLITARFAIEENREVFALPGETTSARSKGTNNLIKQGAKLVEDVEDILQEVRYNLKHKRKEYEQEKIGRDALREDGQLTESEREISKYLSHKPVYIDELASKTSMSLEALSPLLLTLELKKVIRELPGRNFVLR